MIGEWWCRENFCYPETYVWICYKGAKHKGNHCDEHLVLKDVNSVTHVLWSLHGGTANDTGTLFTPQRWHWPPPPKPPRVHHKKALLKLWRLKNENQTV